MTRTFQMIARDKFGREAATSLDSKGWAALTPEHQEAMGTFTPETIVSIFLVREDGSQLVYNEPPQEDHDPNPDH